MNSSSLIFISSRAQAKKTILDWVWIELELKIITVSIRLNSITPLMNTPMLVWRKVLSLIQLSTWRRRLHPNHIPSLNNMWCTSKVEMVIIYKYPYLQKRFFFFLIKKEKFMAINKQFDSSNHHIIQPWKLLVIKWFK